MDRPNFMGNPVKHFLVDGVGNFIKIIYNLRIFLSSDKALQPGESCKLNLAVSKMSC